MHCLFLESFGAAVGWTDKGRGLHAFPLAFKRLLCPHPFPFCWLLLTSKYSPAKPLISSSTSHRPVLFLSTSRASTKKESELACCPPSLQVKDCPIFTNRLLRSRPTRKSYGQILQAFSSPLPYRTSLVFLTVLGPLSGNSSFPWLFWPSSCRASLKVFIFCLHCLNECHHGAPCSSLCMPALVSRLF